jgi:hypothetical protein
MEERMTKLYLVPAVDLLEIGVDVEGLIGLAQDRYSWRALVKWVLK